MLDFKDDERDYLIDVLQSAHRQLLRELHHADSFSFKEHLRQQIATNEQMIEKLSMVAAVA